MKISEQSSFSISETICHENCVYHSVLNKTALSHIPAISSSFLLELNGVHPYKVHGRTWTWTAPSKRVCWHVCSVLLVSPGMALIYKNLKQWGRWFGTEWVSKHLLECHWSRKFEDTSGLLELANVMVPHPSATLTIPRLCSLILVALFHQ